ncbi:MAG: hypothetical protein Q8S84_08430 [bacterium]|nr:hypothetical protein [bacterium]MDP3381461.1 hypothetical protein [bacterium]
MLIFHKKISYDELLLANQIPNKLNQLDKKFHQTYRFQSLSIFNHIAFSHPVHQALFHHVKFQLLSSFIKNISFDQNVVKLCPNTVTGS